MLVAYLLGRLMDNDVQIFKVLRQASRNPLHHLSQQIDIFIRYSEEIKFEDIIGDV